MENYTSFSFIIPLHTADEFLWATDAVSFLQEHGDNPQDADPGNDFSSFLPTDDDAEIDFRAEVDADGFWIYTEEYGSPDQVIPLVQQFLRRFRPDEKVGFSWASYGSKPAADAFDGGAMVITACDTTWINSGRWLARQLATPTCPGPPFSLGEVQ